jgi:hypothetical protein
MHVYDHRHPLRVGNTTAIPPTGIRAPENVTLLCGQVSLDQSISSLPGLSVHLCFYCVKLIESKMCAASPLEMGI